MSRLYIVDQNGLGPSGHYQSYTACVIDGAQQLGLEPVVLANKKARIATDATAEYTTIACFSHTWAEAERQGSSQWEAGNIAYEMFAAFRSLPPQPGDHVFLHTIGYRELLALLECFTARLLPGDPMPYFHILLRRDPDVLIDNFKDYARFFPIIAASPHLRQKLRFHADTDLLAGAFADLSRLPFGVAPIPFEQHFLLQALAARPPRRAGTPLTAVYLGDAREEKGYQHLPAALSHLWPDYVAKSRVRFILQSNFTRPAASRAS